MSDKEQNRQDLIEGLRESVEALLIANHLSEEKKIALLQELIAIIKIDQRALEQ